MQKALHAAVEAPRAVEVGDAVALEDRDGVVRLADFLQGALEPGVLLRQRALRVQKAVVQKGDVVVLVAVQRGDVVVRPGEAVDEAPLEFREILLPAHARRRHQEALGVGKNERRGVGRRLLEAQEREGALALGEHACVGKRVCA